VASSISKSAGGDATLTLKAHRNITFNAGIGVSSTSGKLHMVFNADSEPDQDGAVTLNSGTFTTNGGNLTIGGGADPTTTPAYGSAASSGRGVVLNGSSVNAGGGNISIRGVGRTATASNAYGIYNTAGATVQTSGIGNITLNGTGGGSGAGASNYGIVVNTPGSFSVVDGDLTVTGTGGSGTGGLAYGLYVNGANAAIRATGSGSLSITGQAGNSNGGNTGVVLNGGIISGTSGTVTVTGTGAGTGNSDMGVYVPAGGIISVTTGTLTVEGTGSPNGADGVHGVFVTTAGSAIKATAGGDVTVIGTSGGTGSNSFGVSVSSSGSISNAGGDLDITGTGSPTGVSGNHGVSLSGGSISVTGAGALSIDGTAGGSGAGNTNIGLNVTASSTIAVEHGTATIQATGGGGTGNSNRGLYVSASTLQATGIGSLSLTGQATANTGSSPGVVLTAGSTISTTSGSLSLTGTGAGTGNSCSGLYMDGASVISVVDGPLSVQGTASPNGTDGNHGVHVTSANTAIKALGAGGLTVTGTGGGTGAGASNQGVLAASGGRLSVADGDLTVTGTGGSGSGGGHRGVYLALGGIITSTGAGDLTLTGTAGTCGASNTGIYADNTVTNLIGGAGATGDMTLITDSLDLLNGSLQTSGAITMHPLTAGTTMGIGGGAGTLSVSDTTLGLLNWGNNAWLTLGDGSTGLMTINTAVTFAKPVRFLTAGGADITLAGQLTSSATGAGMDAAVLLTSGDDFHNTFGATALNMTGGGRWLAYSVNPADDTIGSLSADFQRFTCTFGGACPAFPNTGNGFLYAVTPTLVFTPDALTIAYGDPVPALTYTATGYLGADAAADTLVGALTYDTPYNQGDELGTYDITYDNGALASSLGYAVTYADRPDGLTVGKRNITATVHDKTRHYGQGNPLMTWEDVDWTNLFGGDSGAVLDTVALTHVADAATVGTTHAIEITAFSDDHYHLTAYTPGTLTIIGSPDGAVVPVTPDQTPTGDNPAGGTPGTGGNPVGGTPDTGGATSHGRTPARATDRIPDTFERVSQDPTAGLASGETLDLPTLPEKPSDDEPKPTAILGKLLRIHPALIQLLGLDPTHL
jgi:hypothetical protein